MVTIEKTSRANRLGLYLAVLVLAVVAGASLGRAQAPKPANIDRNGVLILIRSTLLALDQANKTGNYTVLRDLGAPAFQTNTAARLGEIFAKQRSDNLDLSGVAAIESATEPAAADRGQRPHAYGGPVSVDPPAGQFRTRVRARKWTMAPVRHLGDGRTGRTRST